MHVQALLWSLLKLQPPAWSGVRPAPRLAWDEAQDSPPQVCTWGWVLSQRPVSFIEMHEPWFQGLKHPCTPTRVPQVIHTGRRSPWPGHPVGRGPVQDSGTRPARPGPARASALLGGGRCALVCLMVEKGITPRLLPLESHASPNKGQQHLILLFLKPRGRGCAHRVAASHSP